MGIRILCIGDVVGRPGRKILAALIGRLREKKSIDFIIVNGENAASGSGLTPKIVEELVASGADVITSGDHVYKNKEIFECLDHDRLLRPLNYVPAAQGHGWGRYDLPGGARLAVVNLQGRVFMDPCECPFLAAETLLESGSLGTPLVLVDFHAEATSEKIAMGWYLDGRATAVFGTHTHVQTADERVLPGGAAYITDLGMTGAHDSVLGREKQTVLHRFTTQMPARFNVAKGDVRLCGAIVEADPDSGKALAIERLCETEETCG